jgi:YbgC/YbaW family acyl-CoA thioester hydrolase
MISPDRNLPSITVVQRVAAGDVDRSAIVHFARYPGFAETAALALLEQHGCGLDSLAENGLDLRVRELRTSYRAPAQYGDLLHLQAGPALIGRAHLRIKVQTTRARPEQEPEVIANSELDFVFYDVRRGQPTMVPQALVTSLQGVG